MPLSPGTRLRTAASSCEVIVVRPPAADANAELICAGSPMTSEATSAAAAPPNPDAPLIALGKRYCEESSGIEVLCVRPGPGPLSLGGSQLIPKNAKPLPASD